MKKKTKSQCSQTDKINFIYVIQIIKMHRKKLFLMHFEILVILL